MKTCFEFSQEENVEVNSVSVLLYLVAPRSLDEYKLEVTDRQAEAMRKTKKESIKQLYDRDHANIRNAYEIRAAGTMLLCLDTDHTQAIYH